MILGTICARGGSKGIPGKNMKVLYRHPLILYTLGAAKECKKLDKVIVSSDDDRILEYAEDFDITTQKRPAELATDTASKWDVFRYIAESNPQYDVIVDLDTGCPLRSPTDIDNCLLKLRDGYDVVITAYEAERNPYFNMVEVDSFNQVKMAGWTPRIVTRRQDAPLVYSLSPAVFAIRREALFQYSHWSRANMGISIIPRSRAIDIDTIDDWNYVEYLMGKDRK